MTTTLQLGYLPDTERLRRVHTLVAPILERELIPNLHYHLASHTLDPKLGVVAVANELAYTEKLDEQERELLLTAAYFHDIGFAKRFSKNESIGAEMAGLMLPSLGYTSYEIAIIQKAILKTDLAAKPESKLEMILRDADVDNLGRSDFFEKSSLVRKELEAYGFFNGDDLVWLGRREQLLEGHRFYTTAARERGDHQKQMNLAEVRQQLTYLNSRRLSEYMRECEHRNSQEGYKGASMFESLRADDDGMRTRDGD